MSIETQSLSLQLTRLFEGPRERVYQAWSNQDQLEKWFGPEGYKTTVPHFDFQVEGTYQFVMNNDQGFEGGLTGKFVEIVPNEKLVFTWRWTNWGPEQPDSLITLQFLDKDDNTEIVLTQENLVNQQEVEGHKKGWTGGLESLHKYLVS